MFRVESNNYVCKKTWDASKMYLEIDTSKNKEFTDKIYLDPQSKASTLNMPASLPHEIKQAKKYSFSQSFWW